jgi:hypothetical protein
VGNSSNQAVADGTVHVDIANSRVGIGTTSPSEKLEVAGKAIIRNSGTATAHADTDLLVTDATASGSTAAIQILGGNAGFSNLQFSDTDSYSQGAILYGHADNYMAFKANAGERMRITSAGNVGIGTTCPSSLLHLESSSSPSLRIKDTTQGTTLLAFSQDSNAHLGTFSSHPLVLDTNSCERMRITSSGNVGIGTTSPSTKLHVDGDSLVTGDSTIYGNLSVTGDFTCIETTVTTTSALSVTNTGTGPALFVCQAGVQPIAHFIDANGDDIVFADDGNVGIGCSNPTCKLDVCGTILANSGGGAALYGSHIDLGDNQCVRIGAADDLKLYHNGTNSYVRNETGNLNITNNANDGWISFYNDDGSGGTAEYLRFDGSVSCTLALKNIRFSDCVCANFGNSNDFRIQHNATDSYIQNYTGNLNITNYQDDGDISFYSDNGAGGTATYFRVDGGSTNVQFFKDVFLTDNTYLNIGGSFDLRLFHDTSNSYIQAQGTGDLIIQQTVDDKDIIFRSDDGAGGIANYFKIDGGSTNMCAFKTMVFADSAKASFGNSEDLRIQHDGTDSYIDNYTGRLYIRQTVDNGYIDIQNDNGSGGLATYIQVDGSSGCTVAYCNFRFNDSVCANFGTSNDLKIYHDGSNSYIKDSSGTGSLIVNTNAFLLKSANDSEYMITAYEDGAVNLMHNNITRLSTTSAGVDVTGNLNVNGNAYLSEYLYHAGDTDTFIRFQTNDVNLTAAGQNLLRVDGNSAQKTVVVNEVGIDVDFRVESDTNTHMLFVDGGNNRVGINCSTPGATLAVNGSFTATCKSFLIDNPVTGGQLKYGVVEGNEHGVTVRGSTCCGTIELPEEWDWLVHEDSVTVQLTPVGAAHTPYVVCQNNKEVVVCSYGCYNYNIYGTRKDVEPLEVNIL